jgi:CRP-like cAMP-binding protein
VIAGVVGLALQSTLSNLFSGIALSLEKPFKIGDWIELQDKSVGQVIEITWRSIWLKTFYNTVLYIPNSELAAQQVTNLNKPDAPYSVWYMIKLSPEIEPGFVKTLLTAAVGRCRHVLPTPSPSIRLNSAVENPYIYSVWVHFRNYLAHFRGQEELFAQIHSALTRADIQVSAPVQEINFAKKRALNPISMRISDTLRSLSIFEELDDEEIEKIAQVSEFVQVEAETKLMHEREKSTKIYIVLNGDLESSVTLEDGRKITGEHFSAGDSFGWSGIFIEEVAFMTVIAISDSLVLAINDKCIKSILSEHHHLIQRFTELVTERMQNLDKARLAATRNRLFPRTPVEIRKRIEQFIKS